MAAISEALEIYDKHPSTADSTYIWSNRLVRNLCKTLTRHTPVQHSTLLYGKRLHQACRQALQGTELSAEKQCEGLCCTSGGAHCSHDGFCSLSAFNIMYIHIHTFDIIYK